MIQDCPRKYNAAAVSCDIIAKKSLVVIEMRMYDVIDEKKRNGSLSDAEINFVVKDFV